MATTNVTLDTTNEAFTGGVDPVAGEGRTIRHYFTGTFAADEELTVNAFVDNIQYDVGGHELLGTAPTFARTRKNKVLLAIGDKVYGSALDDPTGWENRYAGYGFIQASGTEAEAQSVKSIGEYSDRVVILTEAGAQIWRDDPDFNQWGLLQKLQNVGQFGKNGGAVFGDADYFYQSQSGIRSVRLREQLDLLNIVDVGTPIDPYFPLVTQTESHVFGALNPRDGRYWFQGGVLVNGQPDLIFVFSFYQGAKVNAWSTYEPELVGGGDNFRITNSVNYNNRFILRVVQGSSHKLVEYDVGSYDLTGAPLVWLPYLDAGKPGHQKKWKAIDVYGEGSFDIRVSTQPSSTKLNTLRDPSGAGPGNTQTITTAAVSLSTNKKERIPLGVARSTHLALGFQASGDTNAAVISKIVVHYDLTDTP